jgi:hypothetical protein
LKTAAACLAAIQIDRRTDCFVELLHLLGVRRDVLREIVADDKLWSQRPPPPAAELAPSTPQEVAPKRIEVGTIFF